MLELVRSELVTPINPMEVIEQPLEVMKPFLDMVERNQGKLRDVPRGFGKDDYDLIHQDKIGFSSIHTNKFDESIFHRLQEWGLAQRTDGPWYSVEKKTANSLMSFLATLIGVKTNRLPTTDHVKPFYYKRPFANQQRKRETILTSLIPFPEDLDLTKLRRFKEKHSDLLTAFRTRIELVVLDPNIIEGSQLFDTHLAELLQRKQELAAKMSEDKFKSILFGTVCGLIGASVGLATASTPGAIIGGLPGFANAVYSALQIERVENIFDQSGLKFLALADKKLRR